MLERLGERASSSTPAKSRAVLRDLIDVVSTFDQVAKGIDVSTSIREQIARRLDDQCEHYASQIWSVLQEYSLDSCVGAKEPLYFMTFQGLESAKAS